jgi:hypothetical protein
VFLRFPNERPWNRLGLSEGWPLPDFSRQQDTIAANRGARANQWSGFFSNALPTDWSFCWP